VLEPRNNTHQLVGWIGLIAGVHVDEKGKIPAIAADTTPFIKPSNSL
jgi:hypothetical protein